MKHLVQSGRNDKYPYEIYTWRLGEKVPEWLSDVCKVKFMDGEGNITLDTRNTSEGGYEILESTGVSVLIRTKSKYDYVCYGVKESIIFSLTPVQLDLLYRGGD